MCTLIIAQNNQPEPISAELINLDISNTPKKAKNLANRASYNPSGSSQKGYRHRYGRSQSVAEGQGVDTATRSLSGNLKSHPEGIHHFISAPRVPDPCRSVEKLHEFLPDCERILGPSQDLQVTQWMAFIDGKERYDALNRRMEENQPTTTKASAKNIPSSQKQKFQCEKEVTSLEQGQRQSTSYTTVQTGLPNHKDSEGSHGECISDVQNNDGIREKKRKPD
ncbi:hypothetical protein O181_035231 [Austropuccinia psidii MF-1]|uniref:Uncharacterized protein n=1 Tax=Austropuccinia psidii MF-1 TaxID=1389203 RepID=A0A9Q3D7W1_9BASI|nr:hypothetical protein [Austropuccinia psidii MF-1]